MTWQVNNQIYIETRFNPLCLAPFTNPTLCTSSVWVINSRTLDVVARLSSPYLSSYAASHILVSICIVFH
jgi:hypothetical protein